MTLLEKKYQAELEAANESPMLFLCPLIHLMSLENSAQIVENLRSVERWAQTAMLGGRQFVRSSFNFEAGVYEYACRSLRDATAKSLYSLAHFHPPSLGSLAYSRPSEIESLIEGVREAL